RPVPVRRCQQRLAERQFRARADAHGRPSLPADDVDPPVAVTERRKDDVPLAAGRSSAARGEQETCQKQRRGSPSRAQARSLEARKRATIHTSEAHADLARATAWSEGSFVWHFRKPPRTDASRQED